MTAPRQLAHSYRDELPPPRLRPAPIVATWRDVAEIVGGLIVTAALFFGIPVTLWLIGGR